jgi:cytochrome b561
MTRYPTSRIVLHWLMAALILIGYLLGDQLEDLKDAARLSVLQWHVVIGLAVLLLLIPRLRLRRHPEPADWTPSDRRERALRRVVHLALYAVLFLLPVTGTGIQATGRGLVLFDLVPFGGWYRWREAHLAFETVHVALTNLLLVLVALHLAAALWHAVIRRDGVLWRMIPVGSARS